MKYTIDTVLKREYQQLLSIWEASVRATHHFLTEEDILYFKPLILNTYLDAVQLTCIRATDNNIIGFLGVVEKSLEMLFIHPDFFGNGIGKKMLHHAINVLHVTKVDVNEQNNQAVGFYLHCGFKIIGRSELDPTGKPYPILHMEL